MEICLNPDCSKYARENHQFCSDACYRMVRSVRARRKYRQQTYDYCIQCGNDLEGKDTETCCYICQKGLDNFRCLKRERIISEHNSRRLPTNAELRKYSQIETILKGK